MGKTFYHGRGSEGLRNIAGEGVIKGSRIDEEEVFPRMSPEMSVYGKEDAVWLTDSRECAKAYAWGGGYLEVDTENLKVVEDDNSCYAVVMQDEVPIDHVDTIMVENREGDRSEPQRDLDLEIANLLDEEYRDIRIGKYEPNDCTIE